MSTRLPFNREKLSQEFAETSSEQQEEMAETVIRAVTTGPPKPESGVPDLLELRGFLREKGDESIRPGTKALKESRERDERIEGEMIDRLRSDEWSGHTSI